MFDKLTEVKILERNESLQESPGKSRGIYTTHVGVCYEAFFVKTVNNCVFTKKTLSLSVIRPVDLIIILKVTVLEIQ